MLLTSSCHKIIQQLLPLIILVAMLICYHAGVADFALFNWFVIVFSIVIAFRCASIPLLQLVVFFCALFPFYCSAFSSFSLSISDYVEYQQEALFAEFLTVHSLFMIGISLAVPYANDVKYLSPNFPRFGNAVIYSFLICVIIVSALSFRGVNIFTAPNPYLAYVDNLSVESGLPEYLLVILFLAIMFLPKARLARMMLAAACMVYTYKLLVLGYRVQLLMALLVLFVSFGELKLKRHYALFAFFLGFVVFSFLGYIKDGGISELSLADVFFDTSPGFVLSHHTGVIYSSLAVLGESGKGSIPLYDQLMSALGLLLNSIVPSAIVNEHIPQANLGLYVRSLTDTAGGIYAPVVFHVTTFSYIGPLAFGFAVGWLFNSAASVRQLHMNVRVSRRSMCLALFAIMIFSTFPRWVSYDIGNFMLRLPLYLIIMTCFLFATLSLAKSKNT